MPALPTQLTTHHLVHEYQFDPAQHLALQLKAKHNAELFEQSRDLLRAGRRKAVQTKTVRDKLNRVAADDQQWQLNQKDSPEELGVGTKLLDGLWLPRALHPKVMPFTPSQQAPQSQRRSADYSADNMAEATGAAAAAAHGPPDGGDGYYSGTAAANFSIGAATKVNRLASSKVWLPNGAGVSMRGRFPMTLSSVHGFIVDGDNAWLDSGGKSAKKMVRRLSI